MRTEQMQLVLLKDKTTITNSRIIAEVFGKSHDDVLRAIRNLIKDVSDSQAQELLRKIAEELGNEGEKQERRREFGEGAGRPISEQIRIQPPTAYDMELAKVCDKIVERERNELDTEKCQFFKLTSYETTSTQGNTGTFPMYEMNEDGFALLVMGFTGPKATMFKVRFIKEFNRLKNIVNEQLLLDSQKLHQIQDQSRWQDMEWRLRTLEAEKREMSDRLTLLETKGKTVTKLQSDIRRGGFRDAAHIFYPPVRAALRRLVTASSQSNVEKMRTTILYVIELLYKSMDKTVDVTNRYDIDLEATYDEEAVRDFDEKFATQYFGTSTL